RMTKVIKGELKKIKDVKVIDVPLTCDASLEVFNDEGSRLSKMDDDLFTYEVEVTNIPCDSKMDNDSEQEVDDDMGYDPSDLTDEESSNDEDDIAEVFRIDTNIFDYETSLCSAFKEFNYLLEVDPDLLTKNIIRFKTYDDYKDVWKLEGGLNKWCRNWHMLVWKDDGNCNGGYLPGAYIIGNQLHYQDCEWYEALEDCKLKDEALRNKAIMEGSVNEDDDDKNYVNSVQPWCNDEYMMIKYLFNDDEKYVAVKEEEYDFAVNKSASWETTRIVI
ncbi:hypothetical protein Tco_0855953, partial [Tanacetum coccineum]